MDLRSVLIINNGLSGGGIERSSTTLANNLADKGYKVTIVALYKSVHFFTLQDNITFIEPSFSRNNYNKFIYLFKMMVYIRHNIKLLKPDTILSFGEWTNPFVFFSNLGLNVPIYLSDRMSPELVMPFYNRILKQISYFNANGIIAQTGYAKNVIFKTTKAKNIKVIPNPVNTIERLKIPQINTIVSVGRLSPEKGHKYLIEAFSKINNNDWHLSIIGDGPEKDNLLKQVSDLSISDRVIFHGHMKDFTKELSEAKIFVLPSLQEGFPNALLEAMSVPLACISTIYFKGDSEIITNDVNGLLVKAGNVNELTDALVRLINNPDLRHNLQTNAYNVRQTYGMEEIVKLILSFILDNNR